MSSKRIFAGVVSAILLFGVSAWADHDGDHGPGQNNGAVHGKKKGWGPCNLPPGQAKKHGCGAAPVVHHAPPPPPPVHHVVVVAPPPARVVVQAPPPPPPGVGVHVQVNVPPPPSVQVNATVRP